MTQSELRRAIRKRLPNEAFEPQPRDGIIAICTGFLPVLSIALTFHFRAPWYVLLPVSIVLSQMWVRQAFLAHEAMHGANVSSPWLRELICYMGFAVFGFGPEAWRAWHMRAHHARTNHPDRDPDTVGFRSDADALVGDAFTLGSRRWMSIFTTLIQFSAQAQSIVWSPLRRFRLVPCDRARAAAEILAIVLVYSACAWVFGPWYSLWLLLVPGLLANATMISYILTGHMLRPLSETNDPLVNTVSVRTHWLLDRLHLNFSHHREHHLFPSMSWRYLPAVRKVLEELGIEATPRPSHIEAICTVYRTPRMYDSSHSLVSRKGQRVEMSEVWRGLQMSEVPMLERAPRFER